MLEQYRGAVQLLLVHFIRTLNNVVPSNADLRKAYEAGSGEEQLFISRLALFLGTFLKSFLPHFDTPDGGLAYDSVVIEALVYMIKVSEVDDEEIFKTCLEFWAHFAKELYTADIQQKSSASHHHLNPIHNALGQPTQQPARPRHLIYETVLHRLRILMIDRMAKPEEVIIVEDDNGEIVREQTKDTEVSATTLSTLNDAGHMICSVNCIALLFVFAWFFKTWDCHRSHDASIHSSDLN